jgi:PhoD related phosphatase
VQQCGAFQQIYDECKHMYALFQQHSDERRKRDDCFFATAADKGYSWMTQLGPELAVAALDSRAARSRKNIVPPALLDELDKRARFCFFTQATESMSIFVGG